MLSILGFLAILAPLVIVHELGHFLFARLFNVKAETFSIGFGPRLFARQWGETEFRVAAIPLGGFVKLLGEDPDQELSPAEAKRALSNQPAWKRFFIFFGGPLFNFLWAIVVFMAILLIGEPQMTSYVGRVLPNSAAERAGFKPGDRIIQVDGQGVAKFSELMNVVGARPGETLDFVVRRKNHSEPIRIASPVQTEEGYSVYGEQKSVGIIDGLIPIPLSTAVGVSDPSSPAALAGIRTGDQVRSLNGVSVETWSDLESAFKEVILNSSVVLIVEGQGDGKTREVRLTKSASAMARAWGLHSAELFIEKAVGDSPAEKAGVLPGDRIVAVGNVPVTSFYGLKERIQESGQKHGKAVVTLERNGKLKTLEIVPTASKQRDPNLNVITDYTIGVVPLAAYAEPPMVIERILNPFVLFYKATERMVVVTWRNMVTIAKMITGDVSVATLGGPILIGKIAGDSLARGLISFLTMMAVLSVGLGFINILPIPVLDGGHLLLLGIEVVRGRPLTIRQMEIIQQVGLSIIILLMVVVMRNDLARLSLF